MKYLQTIAFSFIFFSFAFTTHALTQADIDLLVQEDILKEKSKEAFIAYLIVTQDITKATESTFAADTYIIDGVEYIDYTSDPAFDPTYQDPVDVYEYEDSTPDYDYDGNYEDPTYSDIYDAAVTEAEYYSNQDTESGSNDPDNTTNNSSPARDVDVSNSSANSEVDSHIKGSVLEPIYEQFDQCTNIAGLQAVMPSGFKKVGSQCLLESIVNSVTDTVTDDTNNDVCPNISRIQNTVPPGFEHDASGNCVVIHNLERFIASFNLPQKGAVTDEDIDQTTLEEPPEEGTYDLPQFQSEEIYLHGFDDQIDAGSSVNPVITAIDKGTGDFAEPLVLTGENFHETRNYVGITHVSTGAEFQTDRKQSSVQGTVRFIFPRESQKLTQPTGQKVSGLEGLYEISVRNEGGESNRVYYVVE